MLSCRQSARLLHHKGLLGYCLCLHRDSTLQVPEIWTQWVYFLQNSIPALVYRRASHHKTDLLTHSNQGNESAILPSQFQLQKSSCCFKVAMKEGGMSRQDLGQLSYCQKLTCSATRDYAGVSISNKLLVLLTFSCGMFTSSTSLLPSSFAMYMLTWAAACVLRQRTSQLIFAAVVCVTWGWPVTGWCLKQD